MVSNLTKFYYRRTFDFSDQYSEIKCHSRTMVKMIPGHIAMGLGLWLGRVLACVYEALDLMPRALETIDEASGYMLYYWQRREEVQEFKVTMGYFGV